MATNEITTDNIKQAVAEGVKIALADPTLHCRYQIDPNLHAEHHAALVRFTKTMEGIDKIRWSVAKAIILMLVMGAISFMGWGIVAKLVSLIQAGGTNGP